MLSGNSLRQTVDVHCASVHQAAKLVAALLRVAGVTAGLAESNGSLPPGLWLASPAGWLPRTGICSGTLRSVIEYGLPLPFLLYTYNVEQISTACPVPKIVLKHITKAFFYFVKHEQFYYILLKAFVKHQNVNAIQIEMMLPFWPFL